MKKALVLGVMAIFAINFTTIQNVNAQGNDRAAAPTKPSVEKLEKTSKINQPSVNVQVNKDNVAATNNVTNKPVQTTTTSAMGNAASTQTGAASTNNVANKPVQTTTTSAMGNAANTTQSGKTTLGTASSNPAATNNVVNKPMQNTTTGSMGNVSNTNEVGRPALGTSGKTSPKLSLKPQNIKPSKSNTGETKNIKVQR